MACIMLAVAFLFGAMVGPAGPTWWRVPAELLNHLPFINITSGAVKAPIDMLGLSNGARSGLTGFVAGLARSSIAAQGVTINNLLPGPFDTDRLQGLFASSAQKTGQSVEALAATRRKGIPAQRFGTPEEFGAACAFLCSPLAGFITGQNLLLDGGAFGGTF